MAAYYRVYGFGHMRTDCPEPGSAPEPYARFEHRTIFIYLYYNMLAYFKVPKIKGADVPSLKLRGKYFFIFFNCMFERCTLTSSRVLLYICVLSTAFYRINE